MVVDLHCDLLSYLAVSSERTPYDLQSKTSYPQLLEGQVSLETLALFSPLKKGSTLAGEKQVGLFENLLPKKPPLQLLAAIENGSIFAEEEEDLEISFQRLLSFQRRLQKILYISLTWNEENRFGGGNASSAGLKPDGKRLLEFLDGKGIAIDLSHTSDALAEGILNYIDTHKLKLRVLASHSNFRSICNQQRNLPDALALEIIRRHGVIGMNFFAPFVHPTDSEGLLKHIEYGLKLGGEKALCFGADFFLPEDFSYIEKKYGGMIPFYPNYADSSCYPRFLKKVPLSLQESIASLNALRFIQGDTPFPA